MSIIVISPHFDDAALSTWTILNDSSKKSKIKLLTICGGIPQLKTKISSADYKCGFSSATQAAIERIKEDIDFCYKKDIEYVHLDELDNPYTGKKNLKQLISKLNVYIQKNDIVYAPLGIGNHPDHIITRDAIINIFLKKNIYLFLYFDYPYASLFDFTKIHRDTFDFSNYSLKIAVVKKIHLNESKLSQKINDLEIYRSQIKMLESRYPLLRENPGILNSEYYVEVNKND